ncbi:MAG: hypothetical protein ACFE7R_01915, partial [Candidatus Hodarchaeota archaeon]
HSINRRICVIVLDFRTGSGPGGNSSKDEWWSLRGCRFEKRFDYACWEKDRRCIVGRCTSFYHMKSL